VDIDGQKGFLSVMISRTQALDERVPPIFGVAVNASIPASVVFAPSKDDETNVEVLALAQTGADDSFAFTGTARQGGVVLSHANIGSVLLNRRGQAGG
jgi:hypothetical protein